MHPVLAVTMGDPAGVGAEIAVKALSDPAVFERAQPFVIGSRDCLERAMEQTGISLTLKTIEQIGDIEPTSAVQVLEAVPFDISTSGDGTGLGRLRGTRRSDISKPRYDSRKRVKSRAS
ncbi:MAG: hypothetical protein U5O39_13950 [Gammaproteobacteria bacterium]|nr:hypothetical protein [Gammaproteobacteria bacterium]